MAFLFHNLMMQKIIFFPLAVFVLLICGCASEQTVITGKARPIISPLAVNVYATVPTNAEIIGTVSVNTPSGFSHYLAHPELEELKEQAANIGANGIVPGQSTTKIFVGYSISAIAIFVP